MDYGAIAYSSSVSIEKSAFFDEIAHPSSVSMCTRTNALQFRKHVHPNQRTPVS